MLRRLVVPCLTLACLGLGGYAYTQHAALTASEEVIRSLQARNTAAAKARATRPVDHPAPSEATVAFPVGVTADREKPTTTDERQQEPARMMPPPDFLTAMDSPVVQQMLNLRARGALDSRYAALFKSLGLPPEQLEKFQQLLADKQSTMRDVFAAMRSQGLAPGRENADQMRTLVQNANTEIDSQIQATLGPAAFAQYQDYERTQPQRTTVERVQQRLSYSSQPLTEQQATQLVNIMTQDPPAAASAGGGGVYRRRLQGNATAPITDHTLEQASSVLSPVQLTALQELQKEQQAQTQLARRARDSFTAPRSAAPAGK